MLKRDAGEEGGDKEGGEDGTKEEISWEKDAA